VQWGVFWMSAIIEQRVRSLVGGSDLSKVRVVGPLVIFSKMETKSALSFV
jgi:hypothetical protein